MKNSKKKVLQFPKPPEEPGAQTILCQIGNERFAIRYEIEDLPLVPLLPKRATQKTMAKIVKWPRVTGPRD